MGSVAQYFVTMVEIFSDCRSHYTAEHSKKFATHEIFIQNCPSTSAMFISVKFTAELQEPVVSVDTFSSESGELFLKFNLQESLSNTVTVLICIPNGDFRSFRSM